MKNKNSSREDMRATVNEEIARTYLKLSDKKGDKKKFMSKVPWIIAVCAILLTALILASRSNIDVKIRIVGEVPSSKTVPGRGGMGFSEDRGMLLAKGAEVNRELVKNISFMGDAKIYSRITEEEIVLCNSKGNGWAGYSIEFKDPIDLNNFDISYTAKGDRGEEYLSVALVDAGNRSYMVEKECLAKLSKSWRYYKVDFDAVKNAIDLSNISSIRFECGSLTVGNSPTATIYLKDIYATKTKKAR